MKSRLYEFLVFSTLLTLTGLNAVANEALPYVHEVTERDHARFQAVKQFVDNVLEHGRDKYGDEHSPLFVDGLNVDTLEPVVWRHNGEEWIISNQANHQNLFRVLTGMTNLTGDPIYKDSAKTAINYMFENQTSPCGLLYWGGHQFVDLKSMRNIGHFDANCHEFKWNFPYYELMWETNPEATAKFIQAFWDAHIYDWSLLEMNRHGPYQSSREFTWDHEFGSPEPFYEGATLSFINAGSDLIYAGYRLFQFSGDEGARTWAERLMKMYVDARHPETKLGVYQYSQIRKTAEPPDDPNAPNFTYSHFGDRAKRQFGPEFGEIALEGNFLNNDRGIYGRHALVILAIAQELGVEGNQLKEWMREGMKAYAEYAYMPETNQLRPMWTDGTDLTGFVRPRPGYFGPEGGSLNPSTAGILLLQSYALGYRLTGEEALWEMARGIAKGHGLGDLGAKPGEQVDVNLSTTNASPEALFALVDLYRAVKHPDYLELARIVGDNILESNFHSGYFLQSSDHINASVDAIEPLALLMLDAVLRDRPDAVPQYNGGRGYIHGQYDGHGRTYADRAIYSLTREND